MQKKSGTSSLTIIIIHSAGQYVTNLLLLVCTGKRKTAIHGVNSCNANNEKRIIRQTDRRHRQWRHWQQGYPRSKKEPWFLQAVLRIPFSCHFPLLILLYATLCILQIYPITNRSICQYLFLFKRLKIAKKCKFAFKTNYRSGFLNETTSHTVNTPSATWNRISKPAKATPYLLSSSW